MAAHHCIQIIQRVVHDLLQFQDGCDIPPATLESISISIELAYRELVVLDLANELNNEQKEAIDIVRRCISDMRLTRYLPGLRSPWTVFSALCLMQVELVGHNMMFLSRHCCGEQIHFSPDIKYDGCFCQHHQKADVCIGAFC